MWKLKAVERIVTDVYMRLNHSHVPHSAVAAAKSPVNGRVAVPAPAGGAGPLPATALASSAAPIIARMNVNGGASPARCAHP